MLVTLEVRGFRNLVDTDLAVSQGRSLLIGPNGAGKTSLLEALYVAATTKSFRTRNLAICRQRGSETFKVAAGGQAGVGNLAVEFGAGGLLRSLDGSRSSLAEHLGALPIVAWTEADREVLAGVPEARRRYVDRSVVVARPRLVEVLARYRQALSHKRELLRTRGRGIEAWNQLLAREGAEIVCARQAHCEALNRELANLSSGLGELEVRLRPSGGVETGELATATQTLLVALEGAQTREYEGARTLVGPHRDRIELLWSGHDIARTASAGERKLYGWLLTLANARLARGRGRPALVLLDDADAELDPARLSLAWGLLGEDHQVLASSSRPELWRDAERNSNWHVDGGRVAISNP
jgi:DNA replication and repair protein RecF